MTVEQRVAILERLVASLNKWLAQHSPDARVELVRRGIIGGHHHYALRLYAIGGIYAGDSHHRELGSFSQAVEIITSIHELWAANAAIQKNE